LYLVATVPFMQIYIPRKTPGKLVPVERYPASSGVSQQPAETPEGILAPSMTSQDVSVSSLTVGETITYAIKSLKISVGKAILTYHGIEELNGQQVHYIQFVARGMNFLDEEKIYASTENFYPVMIKRDLNIFGKKEKIVEEYDHSQGTVKITKSVNNKETEQTIKKSGRLDNIYCFIYRYRQEGKFQIGDSFLISLPTQDIAINLTKMTKLKAAGEQYESYYMMSTPSKYKVWFDTSAQKIPLKIAGSVGLSNTDMTMTSYK